MTQIKQVQFVCDIRLQFVNCLIKLYTVVCVHIFNENDTAYIYSQMHQLEKVPSLNICIKLVKCWRTTYYIKVVVNQNTLFRVTFDLSILVTAPYIVHFVILVIRWCLASNMYTCDTRSNTHNIQTYYRTRLFGYRMVMRGTKIVRNFKAFYIDLFLLKNK